MKRGIYDLANLIFPQLVFVKHDKGLVKSFNIEKNREDWLVVDLVRRTRKVKEILFKGNKSEASKFFNDELISLKSK